jgi:hypothetical protein
MPADASPPEKGDGDGLRVNWQGEARFNPVVCSFRHATAALGVHA